MLIKFVFCENNYRNGNNFVILGRLMNKVAIFAVKSAIKTAARGNAPSYYPSYLTACQSGTALVALIPDSYEKMANGAYAEILCLLREVYSRGLSAT